MMILILHHSNIMIQYNDTILFSYSCIIIMMILCVMYSVCIVWLYCDMWYTMQWLFYYYMISNDSNVIMIMCVIQ